MSDGTTLSASDYKDQGNRYFISKKYDDAVKQYSQAIIKNPHVATYFTNRALCYLKLKRFEQACQDCRHALDLDRSLVKAHFFLGQALLEQGHHDEAIASLQRAADAARDQKLNFGDEITFSLRAAKRLRWSSLEDKRIAKEIGLQVYLNQLMQDECHRKKEELAADDTDGAEALQTELEHRVAELSSLFAAVDDRRQKRDIPDYLCGKISFEIMKDPVITPSGVTYDRKDIEEHLQRVGHFDPVTRSDLTKDQLIPNLALKEVIDSFIQENEWAEQW